MGQHEIEIKLSFKDKDAIITQLKKLGATFKEKYTLQDTYFSLEDTDMKNAKDFLRLRVKGGAAEVTFKGKRETESDIWKRIELTSKVDNPEAVAQMFNHMQFYTLLENHSEREYWQLGAVEIAFIELTKPAKLKFMELEGPSEEEVQKVLDQLKGLVEKVGEDYFKILDEANKRKK